MFLASLELDDTPRIAARMIENFQTCNMSIAFEMKKLLLYDWLRRNLMVVIIITNKELQLKYIAAKWIEQVWKQQN